VSSQSHLVDLIQKTTLRSRIICVIFIKGPCFVFTTHMLVLMCPLLYYGELESCANLYIYIFSPSVRISITVYGY